MTSPTEFLNTPISVEAVTYNPQTGNVPHFTRTIFEDEPEAFILSGKRASATPEEIVKSKFLPQLINRYEKLFERPDAEEALKKRGIDSSQKIDQSEIISLMQFLEQEILPSTIQKNSDTDEALRLQAYEKRTAQLKGLLKYWTSLRSLAQFSNEYCDDATVQADNLDKAIKALIDKINEYGELIGAKGKIDMSEKDRFDPVITIVGHARDSFKNVFRVNNEVEAVSSPAGINVKTAVTRRAPNDGAPIKLKSEVLDRKVPTQTESLENQQWVERRFNIGGLPVAVYLDSKIGSHLLPGLSALFSNPKIQNVSSQTPLIKLFFGVDGEKMGEDNRIVCSNHHELRMFIKGIPEMDYFGYLKKSMLTMGNIWLSIISSVTAAKRYSDISQRDKIKELRHSLPDEFQPLFDSLISLLKTNPEEFQKLMPSVKIPKFYNTDTPGFNPGNYSFFPIHGASYTLHLKNGEKKHLVLPGDSGVGKSEVLRELLSMGYELTEEDIQADDMLYIIFNKKTGEAYSVGTEYGAFTKTDDLPAGGKINSTNVYPVVGYNADEETGNRRVLEPNIASPMKAKKVDIILTLQNSRQRPEKKEKVWEASREEIIEDWIQGLYKPSSSIKGGGNGAKQKSVPFWNEFGPNFFKESLTKLLREMCLDDPRTFGASEKHENGEMSEVEKIEYERNRTRYLIANTYCEGTSSGDLSAVFKEVAQSLDRFFAEAKI